MEIVNSSKVLQAETRMLLDGKLLVRSSAASCSRASFLLNAKHAKSWIVQGLTPLIFLQN